MKHAGAIIQAIQVTEKGTELAAEGNKYLLKVSLKANKIEIKRAVEDIFGVSVLAINTQRYSGKRRRLRNRQYTLRPDWKRAIVTLKEGDRIDVV